MLLDTEKCVGPDIIIVYNISVLGIISHSFVFQKKNSKVSSVFFNHISDISKKYKNAETDIIPSISFIL